MKNSADREGGRRRRREKAIDKQTALCNALQMKLAKNAAVIKRLQSNKQSVEVSALRELLSEDDEEDNNGNGNATASEQSQSQPLL